MKQIACLILLIQLYSGLFSQSKKENSIIERIELNAETGEILKHETKECKVIVRIK